MRDEKMGGVGSAVNLGALPNSNHHFESIGGVMEELNHEILKRIFKGKRELNTAKKISSSSRTFGFSI